MYSTIHSVKESTFSDINLGKTTNTYGNYYGIIFASNDEVIIDNTYILSRMLIRDNSSYMRLAAKSTTKDCAGLFS